MSTTSPYLHLHDEDNVFVLIRTLPAGETILIGEASYSFNGDLSLGHKIAAVDIPSGGRVLKYGMPIGVASAPIRQGEHVHLHNLSSEYTATYTLEEERRFV